MCRADISLPRMTRICLSRGGLQRLSKAIGGKVSEGGPAACSSQVQGECEEEGEGVCEG